MADFNAFFKTLLKHEGGFVNDPDDPGGATNKGVTMNTFKLYAKELLGVEPTLDNLKIMTDEQAGKIYKKMYWDKVYGDDIEHQNLANIFFDFYVNAGGNAVKVMQRCLLDMGQNVTVDGAFGAGSLKALKSVKLPDLYTRYKQARKTYYVDLTKKNPRLEKFLKGWLNRVDSFPA